jgi:cbb3-type cytochrome oxidase subunit 3
VIPTANTWGMGILAVAFLGAIGWMLRARRSLLR